MNTINERIQLIADELFESNISLFEKECGLKPATLKHIVKGRLSKPSYEIIESICRTIVHLNIDWFITGKGGMIKSASLSDDSFSLIEELKAENNQLKGENRILREQSGLGERKESGNKSA